MSVPSPVQQKRRARPQPPAPQAPLEPQRGPSPPSRMIVEAIEPQIDGGRFPIKRVVGEPVEVAADVFADGHDRLVAVLKYRAADHGEPGREEDWRETPMRLVENDRWTGRFVVERLGRYDYAIEAWVDRFGSWREALRKKIEAGQDVTSELVEGAEMVRLTAERINGPAGRPAVKSPNAGAARKAPARRPRPGSDGGTAADAARLLEHAGALSGNGPQEERVDRALAPELAAIMAAHDTRAGAMRTEPLAVVVERVRARFGAWYEMFPRSAGPDPTRSATFDEAAARLPDLAALDFDVVYLPPIHPIGRTNRKGPNNSVTSGDDDPGSPWAIGGAEGGHTAVEPGLGTIEDFDRFVATASRLGLEVALDLAYQCSPDHPYVHAHPAWFRHRPDGTIKYAENPPKKYQDIYPLEFENRDWAALWEELKRIVLFWIGHGVKIFRVDNPHTKPFRFWEWLIAEVRREHPDTIFLSEAFTRPKIMRHLAKLGFSQSYTYFTWRNDKAGLVDYLTELTQTGVGEYFRPNLFANTPDILHEYLQRGGRPAFQARLVLAATLAASYGIYSGFELCENRPVREGSEEYLDSEKYQFRQWDWSRPGTITELIARVNGIRRENRALHHNTNLRFHATDNDQLIAYSKATPDRSNAVIVVVNLDPHHLQHGWVRAPLAELAPDGAAPTAVDDLLTGERFDWRAEWNYVRLDPAYRVAHILRPARP